MTKRTMNQALLWSGFLAMAVACGNPKDRASVDEDEVLPAETPSDSTGATAALDLSFSSNLDALALADDPLAPYRVPGTTGVKVSDAVTLDYAKLSIAKIKLKAKKECSDAEKKLEGRELRDEKERVAEVEAVTGDDGDDDAQASLRDEGPKGKESKDKKSRADKIKSQKHKLHDDETVLLDGEAKRDRATKLKGPFVYDALAGKLEGQAPRVEIPDGGYSRVEFQLKRNFSVDDEEPLLGNVFAIRGKVKKDGQDVPFEISWHSSLNFRLTSQSPFAVSAGEDNALMITFDLARWFAGIDMAKGVADPDGVIRVNKKANRDILKQLRHNIKMGAGFGKARDGKAHLEPADRVGKAEDTKDAED